MRKKLSAGQAAPKKLTRKKKRYVLFCNREQLLGFIFFSLVLLTIGWVSYSLFQWMNDPNRVVLSKFTIIGKHSFTTDKDIKQVLLSLNYPGTFISQDIDVIQKEIMRLPWIKEVGVRKQWPDKLIIRVIEYSPVAYWNDGYLLDKSARVFSVEEKKVPAILPELYGPENSEKEALSMYYHIQRVLQMAQDPVTVVALHVNERYSWSVTVKPLASDARFISKVPLYEIKLILGRKKVNEKLMRFMLLYPTIKRYTKQNEDLTTIDLRYTNGASVLRHTVGEHEINDERAKRHEID